MSGKFEVFNPFKEWEKGDMPCDCYIKLSLSECFKNKDGVICISASLATDLEIDTAVNQLQKDLDSLRKEAKRELKSQQNKIRSFPKYN